MAGSGDPAAGGDPDPVRGKGEVVVTSHVSWERPNIGVYLGAVFLIPKHVHFLFFRLPRLPPLH